MCGQSRTGSRGTKRRVPGLLADVLRMLVIKGHCGRMAELEMAQGLRKEGRHKDSSMRDETGTGFRNDLRTESASIPMQPAATASAVVLGGVGGKHLERFSCSELGVCMCVRVCACEQLRRTEGMGRCSVVGKEWMPLRRDVTAQREGREEEGEERAEGARKEREDGWRVVMVW